MGKNKYHHEYLRNVLIEVASTILEEEGIESLTMRNLSKRVGVSRSAPYRHFEDKLSLLGAVAADGFSKLYMKLANISCNENGNLDQFLSCSREYIVFAAERPQLYRLMFNFELTDGAPVPELADAADRAFSVITEVITGCQEDGSFREADAVELANITWSSLHGLSTLLIDGAVRVVEDSKHLHALLTNGAGRPVKDIAAITESVIDNLIRGFRPECT